MKIFIIILNWKRKELTVECIRSVTKNLNSRNFNRIVVVDNYSKDGSVTYLKKLFPEVIYIQNKTNLGYAGGNNVGITYAMRKNADIIVLLNNDVTITSSFFKKLLAVINSNTKIGIVGPKTYYAKNKKIIADAGGILMKHRYFGINKGQHEKDKGQFDKTTDVDFVSGSAMVIKSTVIKKTGLLDESFFLYYEDVDFCLRAKKAGFKVFFVPHALVFHKFGATSRIGSALHHYYTTRNHFKFVEKHAPFVVKLREILRTPKTMWEFMMSDDKIKRKYSLLGIRDYYLRRFGKRTYWV